jgi:hypothetical protein
MKTIKENLLAGMSPSEAIRQVLQSQGDLSSKELIRLLDDELSGVPLTVVHAVANWNRGRNPAQQSSGLNDAQFNDAVWSELKAALLKS